MMRWAGFMGCLAVLAIVAVSGCKEKTRIVVVQPERTVVREVPVAAEPAPVVEAPAPAPVIVEPAPAPVVVMPAPAPVVLAPAPVVVEPVVTPAVSVGVFVERLGHHGRWVSVATYGQVWVPGGVAAGWQPYSYGHWAYTDAYGWTWVSDEPWGWATYHYGRWVWLEPQGWVWVPGTVWAPAWVVWRSGGGYVGWAPMPPEAVVAPVVASTTEVNINININVVNHIRPRHWVFIEEKHVLEPVHTHIVIAKRSDWIINVTRPSTRIVESHGRIINRSLVVRDVERAAGRKVRSMRIREVDAAADTRTAAKGDEIVMPRARLRPISEGRADTASPSGARGTAGRRGGENAAQPTTPARSGAQRGQEATTGGPALQPAGRTRATPPAADTNGGASRSTDAKPVEPTRKPSAERQPRLDPKPVPLERPADTTRKAGVPGPGRADQPKPSPSKPSQVKPQAPAQSAIPAADKPAGPSRNPAAVPGPVRQSPPPADAPTPGAVRRADVSRQGPAERQGRNVGADRPAARRGKTEAPPTEGAAASEPPPASGKPANNVRREPAPDPSKSVAEDASSRQPRSDPRRDKARSASQRRGERDEQPAPERRPDRGEQPAE